MNRVSLLDMLRAVDSSIVIPQELRDQADNHILKQWERGEISSVEFLLHVGDNIEARMDRGCDCTMCMNDVG